MQIKAWYYYFNLIDTLKVSWRLPGVRRLYFEKTTAFDYGRVKFNFKNN